MPPRAHPTGDPLVSIQAGGIIHVDDFDLEILEFRRYCVTQTANRELQLVVALMKALNMPYQRNYYIASSLCYHITARGLTLSLPQDQQSQEHYKSIQRRQILWNDRIGRPPTLKKRLTSSESRSAKNLRKYLTTTIRDKVPAGEWPEPLGGRDVEHLYHIPGAQLGLLTRNITRYDIHDELRQAAYLDASHANDRLAFQEVTREGQKSNVWKILTRAQLQKQKAIALAKLPDACFTQWRSELREDAERRVP